MIDAVIDHLASAFDLVAQSSELSACDANLLMATIEKAKREARLAHAKAQRVEYNHHHGVGAGINESARQAQMQGSSDSFKLRLVAD